jgi:hypothetical protein
MVEFDASVEIWSGMLQFGPINNGVEEIFSLSISKSC